MKDLVKIGQIVNTHGLKGELRIMSGGRYSNTEYVPLDYIVLNGKEFKVTTHRVHKDFDMIKLAGFDNINQVEHFKGQSVYAYADDIEPEDNYDDIVGMEVVQDGKVIGKVTGFSDTPAYRLLVLDNGAMIPYTDVFVKSVDDVIVVEGIEI